MIDIQWPIHMYPPNLYVKTSFVCFVEITQFIAKFASQIFREIKVFIKMNEFYTNVICRNICKV